MPLMPMNVLGPRADAVSNTIHFGILLPLISPTDYTVHVRIMHEKDQLLGGVVPLEQALTHSTDQAYGDYWETTIDLGAPGGGSSWGTPGTYIYWYRITHRHNPRLADFVVDPFGREFGVGRLSAVTVGFANHVWSAAEANWKVPNIEDLVVYELMLAEFGNGIAGTIARLEYLRDLGINCIEIMPVTNAEATVDWGYLPIGFFGVDERFGNRLDFQQLVDAAHQRGIAVTVDAVYAHTSNQFCYSQAYRDLGIVQNPFLGTFANHLVGEGTDFGRAFVRDFFLTVNEHWLEKYHVDGFRYDYVPGYWDGPMGDGYARLVYETYRLVQNRLAAWPRFDVGGRINIIQVGEDLERPDALLYESYSSGSWQDRTLNRAYDVAQGREGAITALGLQLVAWGYPEVKTANADMIHQRAFQYISSHDKSRFVAQFGVITNQEPLLIQGDRVNWFKVQPYLIVVLLSKGVPMLVQGDEFTENYTLPPDGEGRVWVERPVHWSYYYDEPGHTTLELVRNLLRIRRLHSKFRHGTFDFWNDPPHYQNQGLLVISCTEGAQFGLVAVNFTSTDVTAMFTFPRPGLYQELLHGKDNVTTMVANEQQALTIPRHYGRVWAM